MMLKAEGLAFRLDEMRQLSGARSIKVEIICTALPVTDPPDGHVPLFRILSVQTDREHYGRGFSPQEDLGADGFAEGVFDPEAEDALAMATIEDARRFRDKKENTYG